MKKLGIFFFLAVCILLTACSNKYKETYATGMKYLEEGNYEQAIVCFSEAIEIDPKAYDAYLGRANAYIYLDMREEAVNDLNTALDNGMKASEIPEAVKGDVVDSIANRFVENSRADLLDYLKKTGYFDEPITEPLDSFMQKIISDLITEYENEGKSIDEIISYLKRLGLIEENNVSENLQNTETGELLQSVIDYYQNGKTMSDLDEDCGSHAGIAEGDTFWIMNLALLVDRIPDFYDKAYYDAESTPYGGFDRYDFPSKAGAEITFYNGDPGNKGRGFMTLKYGSVSVRVETQYNSIWDYGWFDFNLQDDISNFLINTTSSNVVTSFANWHDNYFDRSKYLEAVNAWNEILKPYGMMVSDIYDHDTVVRYLTR